MDTRRVPHETEDDFEPVDLGSVSEETRGLLGQQDEIDGGAMNSRIF
ncbi:hypothetical protein [Henriciella aquimarina]|nr:hypothetical protein [Henriciella aquimarina]